MPRRTSTRTITSSATPQASTSPQQLETPYDSNIHQLRRHWKWAAFSQFFFTFSPLLSMADVTPTDVENDLVHSTDRVLSRIMQRLLITLTQDRKITWVPPHLPGSSRRTSTLTSTSSTDSWQNALRRQYQRRDPEASPIGLLARSHPSIVEFSRASTAPPGTLSEVPTDEPEGGSEAPQRDHSVVPSLGNVVDARELAESLGQISAAKVEEEDVSSETLEATEKQPDWLHLSMLVKLDSLHALAEWQFQNPHRVRQQMKTDDEQATWRIEPVGYDSKRNAYWLIGGDRLWIQREPPRPNLKRKRKSGGGFGSVTKRQPQSTTAKRQRIDLNLATTGQSSTSHSTCDIAGLQPSSKAREGRAAKTRANQRLGMQARDTAEFQRQILGSRVKAASISPRKPTGIRVSARLRGTAVEDDEWQEVPDEWLVVSNTHQRHARGPPSSSQSVSGKRAKTGLETEDGSISELTELTDGEDGAVEAEQDSSYERPTVDTDETNPRPAERNIVTEIERQRDEEAKLTDLPDPPVLSGDFVEWETICVSLEEWESFGQRFEKATHYAEKALHKVLSQSVVPMVTAELREIERKRRMEEAVVRRKRSSRIAMKEIEKEEERAAMRKRVEEEEKTSRARRLEVRHQREQAERLRRENAREQRRKERELREQREQSAETSSEARLKPETTVDVIQEQTTSKLPPPGQSEVLVTVSAAAINGTSSGSRIPASNWLLDCEVCGQKGINQDDGTPLLCCGACGKWQHIVCHDKQDTLAGHPKRSWDSEDFICRQCRLISPKNLPLDSPASLLSSQKGQASDAQTYCFPPLNHLRSSSGYNQDSSPNTRYLRDRSGQQEAVPSPSTHSYTSQTRPTGVTFAHYQPQQGGFSTSRPTHLVQDVSLPQHSQYTITPHTASATMTSHPSVMHPQVVNHSPTHIHEQWLPRTSSSYPLNGGPSLLPQGAQPYYHGHAHTPYSHIRGTTNQTALEHYTGLRHVPSYQQSK